MMRGLNIAREIRSLAPASEILFYAKSRSAEALCDRNFRYFVETDYRGLSHWPEVVRSFSPDVIIYDSLLPKDPIRETFFPSARYVYIMRKGLPAKQQEILQSPFLHQVDLILIPHTASEFGYEIPPPLTQKSFFVGPIVRAPNREIQNRLKKKYRIGENDFLLTSTIGGGGFEQAESFFKTVFDIHEQLYPNLPNLRHLIVLGPNFGKSLAAREGMTVIDYEPEMVNLLAVSDLVIAEGGYNTVNEIRLTKTPAIFLPGSRSNDDQEERVRALEKMGLGFVFAEHSSATVHKIVEICSSEACLNDIRKRYVTDRMEIGNHAAAEKIIELVA